MQVSKALTIRGAAELAEVDEATIRAAIMRGELTTETTACRKKFLLSVAAVKSWAGKVRRTGPKVTPRKGN